MIARRPGISGRDRPRAAIVPSVVARMVEKKPMIIEFLAALTHEALAQTSDHHELSRGASGDHAESQQQIIPAHRIACRIKLQHFFGEGEIGLDIE